MVILSLFKITSTHQLSHWDVTAQESASVSKISLCRASLTGGHACCSPQRKKTPENPPFALPRPHGALMNYMAMC